METKKQFSPEDIEAFKPESKVGLLTTVNEAGLPHITLITTMQANGPEEVVWGQFTEGKSKENVLKNPKTGFLIMTLDKNLWRGKALWRESKKEGPEMFISTNYPCGATTPISACTPFITWIWWKPRKKPLCP